MTITVSRVLPRSRSRRRPQAAQSADVRDGIPALPPPVYPSWSTVIGHTLRRHLKDAVAVVATVAFLAAIAAAGLWLLTVRS
jgi:hypothetical protein